MKHRKSVLKLNRTSSHRKAMFRNMVTSLFKHDSIKTTEAKAKGLRKIADKMVTLAKRGDLHARRQALAVIREKNIVHTLFNEVSEKFSSRQGLYKDYQTGSQKRRCCTNGADRIDFRLIFHSWLENYF